MLSGAALGAHQLTALILSGLPACGLSSGFSNTGNHSCPEPWKLPIEGGGIHSHRQGGQVRCHREADSVVWQLRLADAGLGVEGGQRRVWLGAGSRGSQSSSSWRMWENTGLQAALPPRPWRPLLAGAETVRRRLSPASESVGEAQASRLLSVT